MKYPPALAALAASALLLTGCGLFPNADTPSNSNADDDILGSPASDPDDDFQPLQINMVAESGTFPDDVEGVTFGCSDTLVTINTVPTQAETAEEHVGDAIDFLLTDSQYYHGDPAVINSLTPSETLTLDSVETERDAVTVELSGDVVSRSDCETYRIQAQLYGTAALTAGVSDVSITVDGSELNDVLGVEPLDTEEILSDNAD
ncbi:MAG TPA: GerMN domain-containing protein [Candidatus Yaniella excrementigallinarum]|nr:GerMN domain-containing protein [Candidatus Yaniella excrementigallinarum]